MYLVSVSIIAWESKLSFIPVVENQGFNEILEVFGRLYRRLHGRMLGENLDSSGDISSVCLGLSKQFIQSGYMIELQQ